MQFKDNKAIYLQIADKLCDDILNGTYPEDERIISVRECAIAVEVNSNTCVRAYEWLQNNNIIYTKRGLGYFVCAGAKESIMENRKAEFFNEFLPELKKKMQLLHIGKDEVIKVLNEA